MQLRITDANIVPKVSPVVINPKPAITPSKITPDKTPVVTIAETMRDAAKSDSVAKYKCCIIPVLIAFACGYVVGTGKDKNRK